VKGAITRSSRLLWRYGESLAPALQRPRVQAGVAGCVDGAVGSVARASVARRSVACRLMEGGRMSAVAASAERLSSPLCKAWSGY
jgi:hypothetical protein